MIVNRHYEEERHRQTSQVVDLDCASVSKGWSNDALSRQAYPRHVVDQNRSIDSHEPSATACNFLQPELSFMAGGLGHLMSWPTKRGIAKEERLSCGNSAERERERGRLCPQLFPGSVTCNSSDLANLQVRPSHRRISPARRPTHSPAKSDKFRHTPFFRREAEPTKATLHHELPSARAQVHDEAGHQPGDTALPEHKQVSCDGLDRPVEGSGDQQQRSDRFRRYPIGRRSDISLIFPCFVACCPHATGIFHWFAASFAPTRELPRVLVLYDLDMPLPEARKAIRAHFDRYANIKDERVEKMLVAKGYIDLEETLLQHKQRSHLQRTLSGYIDLEGAGRKRLTPDSSIDDQFARA